MENTVSSIVTKACLPHRCLAVEVFVVAGIRLATRCLAIDVHVTIFLRIREFSSGSCGYHHSVMLYQLPLITMVGNKSLFISVAFCESSSNVKHVAH